VRDRLRSFNFCMGRSPSVHISADGCNILAACPIASPLSAHQSCPRPRQGRSHSALRSGLTAAAPRIVITRECRSPGAEAAPRPFEVIREHGVFAFGRDDVLQSLECTFRVFDCPNHSGTPFVARFAHGHLTPPRAIIERDIERGYRISQWPLRRVFTATSI
jgi:hypothetical protein